MKWTTDKCALIGIVFLVTDFTLSSVQAQVYKWVDEKGITQYSNSAPSARNRAKVNIFDTATTPSQASETARSVPSIQEQGTSFQRRRIEREQTECAELAREIIDNKDKTNHLALVAKYNGMCQGRTVQLYDS